MPVQPRGPANRVQRAFHSERTDEARMHNDEWTRGTSLRVMMGTPDYQISWTKEKMTATPNTYEMAMAVKMINFWPLTSFLCLSGPGIEQ